MSDTINTPDNPQRIGKEWYAAQCVCEVCDAMSVVAFPAYADDTKICCDACGHRTMVAVEYLDDHNIRFVESSPVPIRMIDTGEDSAITTSNHGPDSGDTYKTDVPCTDTDARRLVDGVFEDEGSSA